LAIATPWDRRRRDRIDDARIMTSAPRSGQGPVVQTA
jgi:hypothetical protein